MDEGAKKIELFISVVRLFLKVQTPKYFFSLFFFWILNIFLTLKICLRGMLRIHGQFTLKYLLFSQNILCIKSLNLFCTLNDSNTHHESWRLEVAAH